MKHRWKHALVAFLGAASLSISGVVAHAADAESTVPTAPTPSEGTTEGGTQVTVPVPSGSPQVLFTDVSMGDEFAVALDGSGQAWTWGANSSRQLGNGTNTNSNVPVPVTMPNDVYFTEIAAGWTHALALDQNGQAWAWGNGASGRLGNGGSGSSNVPVAVDMPEGVSFSALSAGADFSTALDDTGNAWAWGRGLYAELGNGAFANSSVPVQVRMPDGVSFTAISSNSSYTIALTGSGQAWGWGHGAYGRLGDGSTDYHSTPVEVKMPEGVAFAQVSTGSTFSLAFEGDGKAWAWGLGNSGQLGTGANSSSYVPVAVKMPDGVSFTAVAAGPDYSLAVDGAGNAWSWGHGYSGQLGNDVNANLNEPEQVTMPEGTSFEKVSAEGASSMALDSTGRAWTWGAGGNGQLGNGKTENSKVPVAVSMPEAAHGIQVTSVLFGGIEGTNLVDAGDGTVTVTTPAHEAGLVDVTVQWTADGQPQAPVVYTDAFTYKVPPAAPAIVGPQDVSAVEGDSATFSAEVTGVPTPTVQWQVKTTGGQWTDIPGATETTYTIEQTGLSDNGNQYRAVATNETGEATSDPATLTVTVRPVAPAIVGPQDVSAVEGDSVAFSVEVTGVPTPTVQWQVKTPSGQWTDIPGATETTYTIEQTGLSDNGNQYRAVATNETGEASSDPATLTVTVRPADPVDKADRVWGKDRYGTNLALLKETHKAGDPLFVATGAVYPDALSAGPAAALLGGQIALTPKNSLPSDLRAFLEANKPSKIYIVGGTGAVSNNVATQLGKIAEVERIAGKDRYGTSQELFDKFFADRAIDTAFIATGQDFPDALTASSAAGSLGAPVLLAQGKIGKTLPAGAVTGLKNANVKKVHIVGGQSAVNNNIKESLAKEGFQVDRWSGPDRYATNLAVNDNLGVEGITGLWIATGAEFPDALSAAVPAGAPAQRLVLSKKTCIPGPVVDQWIKAPSTTITHVTLIGGTGVLAQQVENLTACK